MDRFLRSLSIGVNIWSFLQLFWAGVFLLFLIIFLVALSHLWYIDIPNLRSIFYL